MTNEEILANAPEGATHYTDGAQWPYKKDIGEWMFIWDEDSLEWFKTAKIYTCTRSLSDIHRIVELEKRAEQLERERDKLRCAVVTAIDAFDDYDMDVETYAPIKHVKMKQGLRDSLNKFAIEQQIKALEDFKENTSFDMHTSISFNLRVEQLRQQLNGE